MTALLSSSLSARADTPSEIPYTLSTDTIFVGDPVVLEFSVSCPTNSIIKFPELDREKEIVVLRRRRGNNVTKEDRLHAKIDYMLTSFRVGEHVISTNPIICYIDGDPVWNVDFPRIVLHVKTSIAPDNSSELIDIKSVHKLPRRLPSWLWVVLGTVLSAFLTGQAAYKFWGNRAGKIQCSPPIAPHLTALNSLAALKRKGLLEKNECNPFYTELSKILRLYLEGRFNLNAPDETTEEIVAEMSKSSELNGTQRNILQEFMRQADMVKFAKNHPDRTTMKSAFDTARVFVEETIRKEEPET